MKSETTYEVTTEWRQKSQQQIQKLKMHPPNPPFVEASRAHREPVEMGAGPSLGRDVDLRTPLSEARQRGDVLQPRYHS